MTKKTNEKQNFTLFGEETEFEGVLTFTDNLEIAGKFSGTIKSTGNLEFSKTAVCKTDTIEAASILINGIVSGDMSASDAVEIKAGSKVRGNIVTKSLRIDDNVEYDGEITMIEKEPKLDIFSYSASELRNVLTINEEEDAIQN